MLRAFKNRYSKSFYLSFKFTYKPKCNMENLKYTISFQNVEPAITPKPHT